MNHTNTILSFLVIASLDTVLTQYIVSHNYEISTVSAINTIYEELNHPTCAIKRGHIRPCSNKIHCHLECSTICSYTDEVCIYSTLNDYNQCFICVFQDAQLWIQIPDATTLDSSFVAYTKAHPYVKYPNEGCDLVPIYNGNGGFDYSDELTVQGRTLTGIEFCLSNIINGEPFHSSFCYLE